MFRVSTTPIIRSTQNCNYSLRYCAATSLQRGQPWPRWREVAAQKIWPVPEAVVTVRVSTAPIIKSTQNYNYSLRYWSYFLCSYLPPASLATLEGGSGTVPGAVITVLCTTDDGYGLHPNCNYSLRYWSYFLCSYLPPTWLSLAT